MTFFLEIAIFPCFQASSRIGSWVTVMTLSIYALPLKYGEVSVKNLQKNNSAKFGKLTFSGQ